MRPELLSKLARGEDLTREEWQEALHGIPSPQDFASIEARMYGSVSRDPSPPLTKPKKKKRIKLPPGWKKKGDKYCGFYRTNDNLFCGSLKKTEDSFDGPCVVGDYKYFIKDPPTGILRGIYGSCFHSVELDTYQIDLMNSPDGNPALGIVMIERFLREQLDSKPKKTSSISSIFGDLSSFNIDNLSEIFR